MANKIIVTTLLLVIVSCTSKASARRLVDDYTPQPDVGAVILANWFAGETFTPSHSGQLSELVLYLGQGRGIPDPDYRPIEDNLVRIGIYETTNALPDLKLGETTIDITALPPMAEAASRFDFLETNIHLNAGQQYAFLVSYPDGYYCDRYNRNVMLFGNTSDAPGLEETALWGLDGLDSVTQDAGLHYYYAVYTAPEPLTVLLFGLGGLGISTLKRD